MMINFSVVVIGRNEAKTLPRLLASLKEFMEKNGEFIYYDTGSTDGTPDLARSMGCKVVEVGTKHIFTIDAETAKGINDMFVVEGEKPIVKEGDRLFNFAEARNAAAECATNDWVWMPDCDEVFTTFNIDKILEAIKEPEVDILEYEFVFSHSPTGEPVVAFMHSKMYNKNKYLWKHIVHEVLQRIE